VGGWCTKSVIGPYGVSLWKQIRRGWDTFSSFASVKVGDALVIASSMMCGVKIVL
jgi:hypothetical protein